MSDNTYASGCIFKGVYQCQFHKTNNIIIIEFHALDHFGAPGNIAPEHVHGKLKVHYLADIV